MNILKTLQSAGKRFTNLLHTKKKPVLPIHLAFTLSLLNQQIIIAQRKGETVRVAEIEELRDHFNEEIVKPYMDSH